MLVRFVKEGEIEFGRGFIKTPKSIVIVREKGVKTKGMHSRELKERKGVIGSERKKRSGELTSRR